MEKTNKSRLTELSQTEVVTLAVYLLGGAEKALDTEDIAVKAHEIGPGRFSWKKYSDQINLELVRVYLSEAKKAAHSHMLSGTGRTGWRLTQSGLAFAQEVEKELPSLRLSRSRKEAQSRSIGENRWRRERARITAGKAWDAWINGSREPCLAEAQEVFRIDGYAVGKLRETKVTRLRALFKDDDEIAPFLKHLAEIIDS